jgi:hypothetical protein
LAAIFKFEGAASFSSSQIALCVGAVFSDSVLWRLLKTGFGGNSATEL